jgi:hypothetical protein
MGIDAVLPMLIISGEIWVAMELFLYKAREPT